MGEEDARRAVAAAPAPALAAAAANPGAGLSGDRPRGALGDLAGRRPVLAFLLRRVGGGLGTLLVFSLLLYVAVQVLPGAVAQIVLGRTATPERVGALRGSLPLNQPLPARYLAWLT